MQFEQVLATAAGTIVGFGLLFQALVPSGAQATAVPAVQQVVAAQSADGAVTVTEDDPWH